MSTQPTPFDVDGFDDGFIEEPLAPEPPSAIPQPAPPAEPQPWDRFVRQLGHRAAIAAFFVLLLSAGAILQRLALFWPMLLIAFVAGDLALLCGLISSFAQRCRPTRDFEPLGLIIFSVLLLIPTLTLVVLAKRDRLDAIVTAITGH